METEIWKKYPEIVGIEVSTLGRVRTIDKEGSRENGTYSKKGHVLKQWDNGRGYLYVRLRTNGKYVNKSVHRLVAQTFISNPDNLPQVNHRDCNRKNNNVENLEFCDNSYNVQYRENFGEAQNKPVLAINLATLEKSKFPSQMEASRVLEVSHSNINAVIKGRLNKTNGFLFVNDDNKAADAIKNKLHEIHKGE